MSRHGNTSVQELMHFANGLIQGVHVHHKNLKIAKVLTFNRDSKWLLSFWVWNTVLLDFVYKIFPEWNIAKLILKYVHTITNAAKVKKETKKVGFRPDLFKTCLNSKLETCLHSLQSSISTHTYSDTGPRQLITTSYDHPLST